MAEYQQFDILTLATGKRKRRNEEENIYHPDHNKLPVQLYCGSKEARHDVNLQGPDFVSEGAGRPNSLSTSHPNIDLLVPTSHFSKHFDPLMPWSITLPHEVFASPWWSVATPTVSGMLVGYLVNRNGRTKQTYRSLRQPPGYPPAWVFPPVWTLLYATMGYAAHHATVAESRLGVTAHLAGIPWQTLYTSQLALNYLWMPLFFGLGRPRWALVDILLLGGNVAALMHTWWTSDRTACWLMAPYAAWIGFATYLNIGIGALNQWRIGPTQKKSTQNKR
ncbi:TspO/MBR family-domain-containing protein [Aspergillus avenaceus]|uniref:TspO/MBR family-domain-containing protein n=1 Tax=Aspergillus avenaceus TaxID=36643 RepID=A0A5N6U6E8_ASPAV|nr:TspO/MBR family-domain-containing protein [Aspergillus avenaceus]